MPISGLLHLAGADARSAHAGAAGVGSVPDPYALDVRQPTPIVSLVGEADGLAVTGPLPTDLTVVGHGTPRDSRK